MPDSSPRRPETETRPENNPIELIPAEKRQQFRELMWRLNNLYMIVDEHGKVVRFRPNDGQIRYLEEAWYLNVILKARQLGFTTLIDILALDQCCFISNFAAGIIADTLENATKIFRNKIHFPYYRLPEYLLEQQRLSLVKETNSELVFSNGSSISVGTSMRGGTLQFLHISEFGKIAAKYPDKAREIVTGAFNTVHEGQQIHIESTAEGNGGRFYDIVQKARKHDALVEAGQTVRTPLDFKFHFHPWWADPRYSINPSGIRLTTEDRAYFAEIEITMGIDLTAGQKAWYVKKRAMLVQEGKQDLDMKREFPSTPDEAFQVSTEGAYYVQQMLAARKAGRIRVVPHVTSMPVNTFWDLGKNDTTAIWFQQFVASEHRFIDCHENSGEDLAYYARFLQEKAMERKFVYGHHYLPHDANNESLERLETRVDRLVELGIPFDRIRVVDRVEDITVGIELTRKMLPLAYFDIEHCEAGIRAVESYRKEWDEKQAVFKRTPLHNWASNYADALRQWAQGWDAPYKKPDQKRKRKPNWKAI